MEIPFLFTSGPQEVDHGTDLHIVHQVGDHRNDHLGAKAWRLFKGRKLSGMVLNLY